MPNYRKDLADREVDHTHTLKFDVNGGHYEEQVKHYKGTYYGDSITVIIRAGVNEYVSYWKGRCPECERYGHPKNAICDNCDCATENAPNPQGLEKF